MPPSVLESVKRLLPPRWSKMNLHPKQRALVDSKARFIVLPCGRRTGKTELLKRRVVRDALMYNGATEGRFVLGGPTYQQAKAIFWNDIKALSPAWALAGRPSDSELIIRFKNGAYIQVMGLDKPERIEGPPLAGGGNDETGNLKPGGWSQNIRPALTDLRGWWWHIGVPEGRNHYYELYLEALSDDSGEWGVHHWTTEEVLPLYLGEEAAEREIRSAKNTLDELTYQQEYLASFVTFTGLVYYNWSDKNITREWKYNPSMPLHLTWDFNVSPGSLGVAQEVGDGFNTVSHFFDEVHIAHNSTTPRVCEAFLAKYNEHPSEVYCYGDATGGAAGSARVQGSDIDLIRSRLSPVFGDRLIFRFPKANPDERASVNSLNSRLCSADGTRRLFVHPRCKWLIRDFEGVRVIEGTAGEIDKSDQMLTHHSDGVRYYTHRRFPLGQPLLFNRSY